jgi:hypothetical protein
MILGHHQQQLHAIGPEHMVQAAAKGDIDTVKKHLFIYLFILVIKILEDFFFRFLSRYFHMIFISLFINCPCLSRDRLSMICGNWFYNFLCNQYPSPQKL